MPPVDPSPQNNCQLSQDKSKEIEFFNQHGDALEEYRVFTDDTDERIVSTCVEFSGMRPGMLIADLGCGSGIFTRLLACQDFNAFGVDISHGLLQSARRDGPQINYVAGDVEALPLASGSLDGILFSGMLHHLPDQTACAREAYRVLKPGGLFAAFDPNRRNPFMWLYRDRSSPFYSRKGVTENERPVVASDVARVFSDAGFKVSTHYLSGLKYRYIASPLMRLALPIYNLLDDFLFRPDFMKPYSSFVITTGVKV